MTEIQPTEEMMQLMTAGADEDFSSQYVTTLKQLRDHWESLAIKTIAENKRLERQCKLQGLMIEQLNGRIEPADAARVAPAPTETPPKTTKQKEMN